MLLSIVKEEDKYFTMVGLTAQVSIRCIRIYIEFVDGQIWQLLLEFHVWGCFLDKQDMCNFPALIH